MNADGITVVPFSGITITAVAVLALAGDIDVFIKD
jgi:hypothetical protein